MGSSHGESGARRTTEAKESEFRKLAAFTPSPLAVDTCAPELTGAQLLFNDGGGGNAFGVILVRLGVKRCNFDREATRVGVTRDGGRPCRVCTTSGCVVSFGFASIFATDSDNIFDDAVGIVLVISERFFLAGRGGASSVSSAEALLQFKGRWSKGGVGGRPSTTDVRSFVGLG